MRFKCVNDATGETFIVECKTEICAVLFMLDKFPEIESATKFKAKFPFTITEMT